MNTEFVRNESSTLISAGKVAGTAVYDENGERIGHVADVLLIKQTGQVAYAVLSFGGFLGIGEKYHPLPWDALHYVRDLGGYQVGLTGTSWFHEAPSYSKDEIYTNEWWDPTDEYYNQAPVRRAHRSPDYLDTSDSG